MIASKPGSYHIESQRNFSANPFVPKQLTLLQPGTPFPSRTAMLTYECGRRLHERTHLPEEQKYEGFRSCTWITISISKLIEKITHVWHRYGWNKSQTTYDQWLLQRTENLEKCQKSMECPSDTTLKITPASPIRKHLGFKEKGDSQKFTIQSVWHRNSTLNGYAYGENGKIIQIKDGVTSEEDQTSGKLQMACEIRESFDRKRSIAYTGRPDTPERAQEQAELIFKREMDKAESDRQGIQFNAADGTYTLTYIVTNLSEDRGEMKALRSLEGTLLQIDERRVRVKPVYISLEQQNVDRLLEVEEKRNTLKCPLVYHGRGLKEALALSVTVHHYRKGQKKLPNTNDPIFKKLLEINIKGLTLSQNN